LNQRVDLTLEKVRRSSKKTLVHIIPNATYLQSKLKINKFEFGTSDPSLNCAAAEVGGMRRKLSIITILWAVIVMVAMSGLLYGLSLGTFELVEWLSS
jgi:hypothetical protein